MLVGSDLNSFSPFVSFRGCLRVIPFFVLIYKGAFIGYREYSQCGLMLNQYIISKLYSHTMLSIKNIYDASHLASQITEYVFHKPKCDVLRLIIIS